MMNLREYVTEQQAKSLNAHIRKTIDQVFVEELHKYRNDYYPKRKYGKWTIYNKEGMRVAWGLNEKEMKAYMKLLKEEN